MVINIINLLNTSVQSYWFHTCWRIFLKPFGEISGFCGTTVELLVTYVRGFKTWVHPLGCMPPLLHSMDFSDSPLVRLPLISWMANMAGRPFLPTTREGSKPYNFVVDNKC